MTQGRRKTPDTSTPSDPFSTNPDYGKSSNAGTLKNLREGEARRELFMASFVEFGDLDRACAAAGVTRNTYGNWRTRFRLFAARVDELKRKDPKAPKLDPNAWTTGFAEFRKVFFGNDSAPHHQRTIEIMEAAIPGSITMILYAPEHGKTTLLEDYDCYKIAENKNFRITVGSEGQPHSRKILARVKRRMTDRRVAPEFMNRFGPFYVAGQERDGKPWAADYFTVAQASHDERDYTMEARGMKSAIAGTRTDQLQVDDPQSRKTLNLTDSLVETFRQDWLSRPGQDGRTFILGTRVGDWDFFEALQNEGIVTDLVCFPAVLPDGSPLWEEKWPLEKLMAQRKVVGEVAWWRNYMQAPRSGATATFARENLDKCHNELLSVTVPDPLAEAWRGPRVLTVDPALGGGCAFLVAELSPDRMRVRMTRCEYGLSRVEQILDIIDDTCFRYRPAKIVIEENAFQRSLGNDDRLRAIASRYGAAIVPHQTGDNKHDEDFGVASMATDIMVRRIELPYADELSIKQTNQLEAELCSWRPHVKGTRLRMDRVMTMWFAWLQWRTLARVETTVDTGAFQRRGLPWTPTQRLTRVG